MTQKLPTGSRECLHLEFLGAEALREPHRIAREIVAMLNADGGNVWIGIPDEEGMALHPVPVEGAERSGERLHSQLLDLIDPAPTHAEVTVELVPIGRDGNVLVVIVRPPEDGSRRPFAWTHKGMYGFDRRDDHRVVRMSREEIRIRFGDAAPESRSTSASIEWLSGERDRVAAGAGSPRCFAGLIVEGADMTSDSCTGVDEELRVWWSRVVSGSPERLPTSPRWSVLQGPVTTPRMPSRLEALVASPYEGDQRRVLAYPAGAMVAEMPTAALTFADPKATDEAARQQFHPYHLIGLCSSFCELGGELLRRLGLSGGDVLLDVAIFGGARFPLRAYSPTSAEWSAWRDHQDLHLCSEDSLELMRPVRTAVSQLIESPHGVAVQLVERLYEAFGFALSQIPSEVDREAGAVRLPT